jgi:hypothetical protein
VTGNGTCVYAEVSVSVLGRPLALESAPVILAPMATGRSFLEDKFDSIRLMWLHRPDENGHPEWATVLSFLA